MIISNNDSQNNQSLDKKIKSAKIKTTKLKSETTTKNINIIKKLETEEFEAESNSGVDLETVDTTKNLLRPNKLVDLIGQGHIVKQLKLILDSALIRETLPEHLLFYGQPGLGKTTLASLIANELGANFKVITAPSLQKIGDVVSILVGLEPNTVLFIDEIHRLKAPLEETLYGAMEDGQVDLVMGKGNGISTLRMDLNSFVLVGATTQLGKLSKPLKDRFPTIFQLESYNIGDMFLLVERSCRILNINIEDDAKLVICNRSRGVPRVANNILKRLLDYQVVHKYEALDKILVLEFFDELGIFDNGLTKSDLKYMKCLVSGVLGLKTIGSMMQEDTETIELVIEPYLIHLGYIVKSSEGRGLSLLGKNTIRNIL
jgi:Holliday junction DNA helicase RuvB